MTEVWGHISLMILYVIGFNNLKITASFVIPLGCLMLLGACRMRVDKKGTGRREKDVPLPEGMEDRRKAKTPRREIRGT